MSALQNAFGTATEHGTTASERRKRRRGKGPRYETPRDCPRVTLRLSVDDHQQLKELADGMALSTYIRAKALGDDPSKRRRRSSALDVDRALLAQLLGLLGQSRIANNLNQLAYHANIGSLEMDEVARDQIDEAYRHVLLIRTALMKALGRAV